MAGRPPEGSTLYDLRGPGFADRAAYSVESSHSTRVDQPNSLGLGENVTIATGNLFHRLHARVDGEFATLRIAPPRGC